jgi:small subunit ribosomal protein S17
MEKTIVVAVDKFKEHPKYKKRYKSTKRYKVDVDNAQDFKLGDKVIIGETRARSKDKKWKLIRTIIDQPEEEISREENL